jgi:hypothetical protein
MVVGRCAVNLNLPSMLAMVIASRPEPQGTRALVSAHQAPFLYQFLAPAGAVNR